MIRRIREFVKQQEPNRSPCELSVIVQDAIGLSQLEGKNHATYIEVNGLDTHLQVMADPILIEQVLINLVKNGLEAMVDVPAYEKALIVQLKQTGHFAKVSVIDRGTGVPENLREKLFESREGLSQLEQWASASSSRQALPFLTPMPAIPAP